MGFAEKIVDLNHYSRNWCESEGSPGQPGASCSHSGTRDDVGDEWTPTYTHPNVVGGQHDHQPTELPPCEGQRSGGDGEVRHRARRKGRVGCMRVEGLEVIFDEWSGFEGDREIPLCSR